MSVRETVAMIAGMDPELVDGDYAFCTTAEASLAAECLSDAVAMFREKEGTSFILPVARAAAQGFDCSAPMRRITLNVYSALEGVGLTAAVASALAEHGIPCNMVAAYHHDHVFVPAAQAEAALEILTALSGSASNGNRPQP